MKYRDDAGKTAGDLRLAQPVMTLRAVALHPGSRTFRDELVAASNVTQLCRRGVRSTCSL